MNGKRILLILTFLGLSAFFVVATFFFYMRFSTPFPDQSVIDHRYEMSLSSLFSFQASLYETLIAFLVALNGFVGALAIFYIKINSEDKVKDFVDEKIDAFLRSVEFQRLIEKSIEDEGAKYLSNSLDELETLYEKFEIAVNECDSLRSAVSSLESERIEMKRHLQIISNNIAARDYSEEDEEPGHVFKEEG